MSAKRKKKIDSKLTSLCKGDTEEVERVKITICDYGRKGYKIEELKKAHPYDPPLQIAHAYLFFLGCAEYSTKGQITKAYECISLANFCLGMAKQKEMSDLESTIKEHQKK